uniref:Uncharacterized protein n=1 Tax=Marseillevirus LCMAC102 TaxID=2506603 RepID=A0A481YTS8_9VIRU|nr:MAG: hypothetical protein LCMAC102_04030 [Marseillevirus LCMAC102]
MGMFPYECPICGGGYKRCGSDDCDDDECDGGQFCWENEVYFKWKGKYRKGKYSGYGYVKYENKEIYSLENKEKYFKSWGNVKYTTENFTCASCIEKYFNHD